MTAGAADVVQLDQLGRLWPVADREERDELGQRVFHLRSQGLSNAQIRSELLADGHELSTDQIRFLLRHGSERYQVLDLELSRSLELYRLDRWQARVEAILEVTSDPKEVAALTNTLLAISARRARYTGLETPHLVDVTVSIVAEEHRHIAALLLEHREEILDAELVDQGEQSPEVTP